jgi:hypothetical protein
MPLLNLSSTLAILSIINFFVWTIFYRRITTHIDSKLISIEAKLKILGLALIWQLPFAIFMGILIAN